MPLKVQRATGCASFDAKFTNSMKAVLDRTQTAPPKDFSVPFTALVDIFTFSMEKDAPTCNFITHGRVSLHCGRLDSHIR